jgi:hypothetical protein
MQPSTAEDAAKIEAMAREMCREAGIDPDAQVFWGEPQRLPIHGVFVAPREDDVVSAWVALIHLARAAYRASSTGGKDV